MTARMRVTCACLLTEPCRCGDEAPVVPSGGVTRASWRAIDIAPTAGWPSMWCGCGTGGAAGRCWCCGAATAGGAQ